jgi:hypothetical protein
LHATNINAHSRQNLPGEWTASAWMLERRRPKEYAQRHIIEQITDRKVLETIKFLVENVSDSAREELAAAIQLIPDFKLNEAELGEY